MNICFLGSDTLPIPPPKGGGAEKFTYALAKTFSEFGHNVRVISLPLQSETTIETSVVEPWSQKIGLNRLGKNRTIARFLDSNVSSYSFALGASKILRKLYRKDRIDVVHSQLPASGLSIILSGRSNGTLFVHTSHGYHTQYPIATRHLSSMGAVIKPYERKMVGDLEDFVLERADLITVVSQSLKNRIIENLPNLEKRIHVVPAQIDTKEFNLTTPCQEVISKYSLAGRPVVLYSGRIIPIKGIKYLILAAAKLVRETPDLIVVLSGPISFSNFEAIQYSMSAYTKELHCIIKQHDLEQNVVFAGYVSNAEQKQLCAAADIVVLPSIWEEPCSVSILEGMACGKPVVATRIGGNPELVVDGQTGVLVPPADVDSLAEAIRFLVLNKEVRIQYGRAGRERVVQNYSWEAIARNMLSVYERT